MRLFEARFKKGKPQWVLSKATGISQSKISLIERGYQVPTEKEKALIAKALGFQIDEIKWSIEQFASKTKLPISATQMELPFKRTDR